MDDKLILQPNWHSEIYRTLAPKLDVTILYKYLDFIEVSEDGHVLIGSSNLTGRTWHGSVWYYETFDLCSSSNLTTYVANKTMNAGIVDGKFLKSDSTKMIVCDDSGCIHVLSLPENGDEPDDKLQLYKLSEEHESIINSIELFKTNDSHFITCCSDATIKIWDLEYTRVESNEYLNSLKTYNAAHNDIITSIDTHLTNNNIFVSCSLDQHVLLWDQRYNYGAVNQIDTDTINSNIKESKSIYLNEFNGLTNIKWYPSQSYDYLLTCTTDSGVLYTLDIRNINTYLYKLNINTNESIYSTKYNLNGTLLAICNDNNIIYCLDTSTLYLNLDINNIVYKNHSKHTDFIRGLAWNSSTSTTLYTCGWDQQIHKHSIQLNNN